MKNRITYLGSLFAVAILSMAPGYGRPVLEVKLDNLIERYEAALDPESVFESMLRQVSSDDWSEIEERANDTIFRRRPQNLMVKTAHNLVWVRESGETGPKFFASYFPVSEMNPVSQGGTLFVRPDGIQINASLMHDGTLVWAFTHPDGRVFKRTTRRDGTYEYASSQR